MSACVFTFLYSISSPATYLLPFSLLLLHPLFYHCRCQSCRCCHCCCCTPCLCLLGRGAARLLDLVLRTFCTPAPLSAFHLPKLAAQMPTLQPVIAQHPCHYPPTPPPHPLHAVLVDALLAPRPVIILHCLK